MPALAGIITGSAVAVATLTWLRRRLQQTPTLATGLDEPNHGPTFPLFHNKRNQLLQEYAQFGGVVEVSEAEKMANQLLREATWLAGYSITAILLYPPLVFLSIPPLIYLAIPIFREARRSLVEERKVNTAVLDALVILGSVGFIFSNPSFLVIGTISGWLFAVTNKLVVATEDQTRQGLTNLFGKQPQTLWIVQDGVQIEIPFESVQVGDLVVIEAGQIIPVDGVITEGLASVDQQALTGEAQLQEKGPGDEVFAATIVLRGRMTVRVEKTGTETVSAQIGQVLNQMVDYRSSLQLRGQAISDRTAGPTLVLSALALPLGPSSVLAILYSGIGYTMKLLGPLSVLNFLQVTARHGILIKDGRVLEQIRTLDTVVFDKTGTLTLETPHVGQLYSCNGMDEIALLTVAAAAEQRQPHPLARAICQAAHDRGIEFPRISDAAYQIGYGIQVVLEGRQIRVGSRRFMEMESIALPPELNAIAEQSQLQGYSLVYVAIDNQIGGAIELQPTVRPEAKRVVHALQEYGLDLYIISGDHEVPTRSLASQLGITQYFAETLPQDKANLIAQLQQEGRSVCFVGDGINDSVALKQAQVSISLRGASTIATDTAQIILMDETLNQLPHLFALSQKFEANMKVNLMTSVIPGVVIIGGAFLGMVGYGAAILWFNLGLGAGLINTLLPLLQRNNSANSVAWSRRTLPTTRTTLLQPTRTPQP